MPLIEAACLKQGVERLKDIKEAVPPYVSFEDIRLVVAHLRANGVAIEEGPVAKQGARGTLRSVYCRDPDGSLIEISSYETAAG